MAYYPKDRNPSGVVFFGDSGQHQVLESDSTFVYKTGDGYLGINTNNPHWELDVSGTGTFTEVRWADGTSQTTAAAGAYTFDAAAGNETAVTINNNDVLRFSGLDGIEVTRSSQTMQFDLKDTAVTPGSYGNASTISTFTVDQQGRLTTAGQTSVSITASQVSDFGSQVSGVIFDANNFIDSATIDFTVTAGQDVTAIVKDSSITEAKRVRTTTYNPAVGALTNDVSMVTGHVTAYTLPAASSNNGRLMMIKKNDASAESVIISGNAPGELIDSGNQYFLYNQHESVTLVCDGADWQVF